MLCTRSILGRSGALASEIPYDRMMLARREATRAIFLGKRRVGILDASEPAGPATPVSLIPTSLRILHDLEDCAACLSAVSRVGLKLNLNYVRLFRIFTVRHLLDSDVEKYTIVNATTCL